MNQPQKKDPVIQRSGVGIFQATKQQKALRWVRVERKPKYWSRVNKGASGKRGGTEKGKGQIRQGMVRSWNFTLLVMESH